MSDDLQQLFASQGLRCTRQRKAIYNALASSKAHPGAEELYRKVAQNKEAGGLSLATVYNTLEAFCKAGLAQKLPGAGENGSARYDAMRDDHLHMRSVRTGAVTDVPDDLGKRVLSHIPAGAIKEIESRLGFKVSQIQIELVGDFETATRSRR